MRVLLVEDDRKLSAAVCRLLEKDRIPAHKFDILTNLLMFTPEKYRQLEARFAAEKATVLHQYFQASQTHPED